MIINVSEIDENGFELNTTRPPKWLDNLDELNSENCLINICSDIEFDLFIQKIGNEIDLSGSINFSISGSCALCLTEVKENKNIPLRLILSLSKDEDDIDEQPDDYYETYSGEKIDLSEFLKEQIVLSLPYKLLCKEDCKGLCPKCGTNLNIEKCNCKNNWEDSKFAVLRNIKV